MRVVKENEQIGILSIDKAQKVANDMELDLVEIVPNAKPPVCKIINFDKFRYQQKQKEKEKVKKQKANEIKQIRLRPSIQDHDVEVKVTAVKKFLAEGKNVLLSVFFKNREMAYKEKGFALVNQIVKKLGSLVAVEERPRFEGRRLVCRLIPTSVSGDRNAL